MQGDFSRLTFDPARHFSRVLMQQGRVQVDADWNEQGSILLALLRDFTVDLLGPHCGTSADSFKIVTPGVRTFGIAPGSYYADGVPCRNPLGAAYGVQPFLETPPPLEDGRAYLVYLDAWERHITWMERLATDVPPIREVALGEADTASRAQIVWQIKAARIEAAAPWQPVFEGLVNRQPKLKAQARKPGPPAVPCVIEAESRYRGLENQLYRVEVHRGGIVGPAANSPGATFKWSRENASVLLPITAPVTGDVASTVVQVSSLGRDAKLGLNVGDIVEVIDNSYSLGLEPDALLRVESIDRNELVVTLEGALTSNVGKDLAKMPLLRRWDHKLKSTDTDPQRALHIVEAPGADDAWLDIEDGIQVKFEPGGSYQTGDHWLIPARVATGDIEWPRTGGVPDFRAANGIAHHYAPLATITVGAGGAVAANPVDLRTVVVQPIKSA